MTHENCACPDCQREAYQNPLAWIICTPKLDLQVEAEAVHAVPDNDSHLHHLTEDGQCACNPWIDEEADGLVWVHNSFDGRELYARGLRKLN